MATNMHTIFSDTIKGAGLIASGPYTNTRESVEDRDGQTADADAGEMAN